MPLWPERSLVADPVPARAEIDKASVLSVRFQYRGMTIPFIGPSTVLAVMAILFAWF